MDFLRRLNPANATLTWAAQPVLAPRFAPARTQVGFDEWARDGTDEARASQATATSEKSNNASTAPQSTPPAKPKSEPADSRRWPHSAVSPASPIRPMHVAASPARPMPSESNTPVLDASESLSLDSAVPTANTIPFQGTARDPTRALGRAGQIGPSLSPTAIANRQPMPLTANAMAGRVVRAETPAPVIHVTIDRIDVRSPQRQAPSAAVAAKRERPAPSVSLAEYLRTDRVPRSRRDA